ncbi:MAG: hypothetical protein ACI382_00930 [Alloprevotella sp.]
MEISEILNIVLGGGLAGTLLSVLTLRESVKKAQAEARRAEADAETVRMDNAEHATRILVDNIVKPLKEELHETRRYLAASKREMARLRKAIDGANSCRHIDICPVLERMREGDSKPYGEDGDEDGDGGRKDGGQPAGGA